MPTARNFQHLTPSALFPWSSHCQQRGLEELFFQLCCCVSFWFWWEIGFDFTYLHTLLNNFFGTNIFLIVVEVWRYFERQFRYFCTNFLVESKFLFQHRNMYSEGMVKDRKLHVDTMIFIPTWKTMCFHIPDRSEIFAFCERMQLIPMLYPRKQVCGIFW